MGQSKQKILESREDFQRELNIKEIEKIDSEINLSKMNFWWGIFKAVAIAFASIIVFLAIQRPDSVLNRKSSKETISRERANLILDLLKESDPQKIAFGLEVIKQAYPSDEDSWIEIIQERFSKQANLDRILALQKEFSKKRALKEEFTKNLKVESSREKVDSVQIEKIRTNIKNIDEEIAKIISELKILNINIPTIDSVNKK